MTGIITSLPPLIEQPPGNASSNPAGLPGYTYTIALLGFAQTWTAKQSFPLGMITLNAADITGTLPFGDMPALTGDITTVAGDVVTTLATVNGNVGSFGSATQSLQLTINGKGLVTAAAASTVTPAVGSITGLGTGVATALGIAPANPGSFVVTNAALGAPSSGTATNLTGLPVGTGISGLGAGVAAFLATPSSANMITAVTDETGSGVLVFGTGPTLSNPVVGTQAILDNTTKAASTAYVDRTTREKLTAARTYFIRSDGSDANTGLVDSAGGAKATFAAIWTLITGNLNLSSQTVTIKIGGSAQTITNGWLINQSWDGAGSIVLDGGNGTISCAATCISNLVTLPGLLTVQNVTLTSSGGGAIATIGPGTITVGAGVVFGAVNASFRHMDTQAAGARISAGSPYTITGGGQMHLLATGGGEVQVSTLATVTGRIVFSFYAYGDRLGFVNCFGCTWKGSATFTVTIATPAVVTQTAHGFSINDPWVPGTTGALPTGLTAGTTYFIIAAGFGVNAFEVSTTVGGAAVNTTGTQSGVHNAFSISGQRYNASGLANVFTNGSGINYFPGSTAGVGTNPGVSPFGYYN